MYLLWYISAFEPSLSSYPFILMQYNRISDRTNCIFQPPPPGRCTYPAKQTQDGCYYNPVYDYNMYLPRSSICKYWKLDNYNTCTSIAFGKILTKEAELCLIFLTRPMVLVLPVLFSLANQSSRYLSVKRNNVKQTDQAVQNSEPPAFCPF